MENSVTTDVFLGFRTTVSVFILMILISSCGPYLGQSNLLAFIEDSKTTREQVFLNLGEPAASYEDGRILCFRLGKDKTGYFIVLAGGTDLRFMGVNTSLVMVFDEQGILKKHSLVQVKEP